jgi:hypothetical protein
VRKARSSKPFSTCPAAAPDTNWKKGSTGTNIKTKKSVRAGTDAGWKSVSAGGEYIVGTAAMAAMQLGKHAYCEKLLAYTIFEARLRSRPRGKAKTLSK